MPPTEEQKQITEKIARLEEEIVRLQWKRDRDAHLEVVSLKEAIARLQERLSALSLP